VATELQKLVWEKLKEIPEGRVTTYKHLADALNTKAVRSVASAVGKNPYAPNVPCHRVVLSSKRVGQYTHILGVKRKIELLQKEGVEIDNNLVVNFDKIIFSWDAQ